MIVVSIAQYEKEFVALEKAVEFGVLLRPKVDGKAGNLVHKKLRIPAKLQEPRSAFADIQAELSELVAKAKVTVLVSQAHPLQLNPLLSQGLESLLAMLILAFPEVSWFFGTIHGHGEEQGRFASDLIAFRCAHGLQNFTGPEQTALFDSMGLRDWVRQRAIKHEKSASDARYLPTRVQLAMALDEETPYAHLHAYTAYRFGYRAVAATRFALAKHLFGDNPRHGGIVDLSLALEDIYVNFADDEPGLSKLFADQQEKLSTGKGRAIACPRLAEAQYRIFVTSGQRLAGDEEKWERNQTFIAEQKAAGIYIKTLYKPYAGIFRLWQGSGLMQKLRWPNRATGKTHHGVADKFIWPPSKESFSSSEHGHSSPGILLLIAEKLIARAERLLPDVHSVEQAVHGAVLANDALELLGCRTPTVAVEALRLKHHFEVLAECQFSGVEHHIRLKERLEEIQRDVNAISQWFGRGQRETASLNAEMQILLGLVRVFREFGQFDEENTCMQQVRALNRQIWFNKEKPWVAPLYPIRWYVEFLLGSAPRFVGAIGVWILVLTALFATTGIGLHGALEATFSSFVGIQPPAPNPSLPLTMFAMLAGATHLGIFISHLYTLVSRK